MNGVDDMPKLQTFHGILEDVLATQPTGNNQEIIDALESEAISTAARRFV